MLPLVFRLLYRQRAAFTRDGALQLLELEEHDAHEKQVLRARDDRLGLLSAVQPQGGEAEVLLAARVLRLAADTLLLPQGTEALLAKPSACAEAVGLRDLRPVVGCSPRGATMRLEPGLLVVLTGPLLAHVDKVAACVPRLAFCPRAVCVKALSFAEGTCAAVCVRELDAVGPTCAPRQEPASKKPKLAVDPKRALVRHILLRHVELKNRHDSNAKSARPPTRSCADAERELLAILEQLLQDPDPRKVLQTVRSKSECSSSLKPGDQAGLLGWTTRGTTDLEPVLQQAVFALDAGGFSDLVHSSRGVHILQRVG